MSTSVIFWGIGFMLVSVLLILASKESQGSGGFCAIALSLFMGIVIFFIQDTAYLKYIGILLFINAASIILAYFLVLGFGSTFWFEFLDIICWVYVIIFVIFGFVSFKIYSNYVETLVPCDVPVIEETRYILCEKEEYDSEPNLTNIMKYDGTFYSSYFKFYCASENENGEVEIIPFEMRESDLKLIVDYNGIEELAEDYLLKTTTTYYGENKNAKNPEKEVISCVDEYELYLRKDTFVNMTIIKEPMQ